MINAYSNYLIKSIKAHELVHKHRNLRVDDLKKSHFELLSEIISESLEKKLSETQKKQLGFTISGKTLSNIFKKELVISYPIDPRFYATLTKIVVFLGYENWDAFADYVEEAEQKQADKGEIDITLRRLIEKSINAEFLAYQQLPEVKLDNLYPFYVLNQSAILQIKEILSTYQSCNWHISNSFNPSTVDLLDFEILSIDGNNAKIKTEEYWLLCWFDTNNAKYVRRFRDISSHIYLLQCIDGEWKVKTKAGKTDVLAIEPSVATL